MNKNKIIYLSAIILIALAGIVFLVINNDPGGNTSAVKKLIKVYWLVIGLERMQIT